MFLMPGSRTRPRLITNNRLTNSLTADVLLNNTGTFFDGPSVAQGTHGIWFAFGTITLADNAGSALFIAKLWDGTTIIASADTNTPSATSITTLTLSGVISSPIANIRMTVKDSTSTSGKILFNSSGLSKDSTITVIRIG